MTQDEIIRMAREAGFLAIGDAGFILDTPDLDGIQRFAALVAAHEREKQAEQEPVAVVGFDTQSWRNLVDALTKLPDGTKLYAEPANKTEEKPLLVQAWEKRFAKQAEQEPAAFQMICPRCKVDRVTTQCPNRGSVSDCPMTATAQNAAPVRTKDLTDDEIDMVLAVVGSDAPFHAKYRAVIAADREKNK